MGIGNKLEALLSERNMTVTELARAVDVAPTTIYSIIQRNNKKVDIDVLIRIAKILGVNAEYFGDADQTHGSDLSSELQIFETEPGVKSLLVNFGELNAEGRTRLVDYSDDLVQSGKYKKRVQDGLLQNEA